MFYEEDVPVENRVDLAYSDLDLFPEHLSKKADKIRSLRLNNNRILVLPRAVSLFHELRHLDISANGLTHVSAEITQLPKLRTFIAKNNLLEDGALPKELHRCVSLEVLNLSGNVFTEFPEQITEMAGLRVLYLGANRLWTVPSEIKNMSRLEILYLGGNQISTLPVEVGSLSSLMSLVLCDNRLESLPPQLARLRSLRSLSLHNNRIAALPSEIIALRNLTELSLRGNPLVVNFVRDLSFDPPTLLELAGRGVKNSGLRYAESDVPPNLHRYLSLARKCPNPKCTGVYFDARVKQIKFVDFCGKYRLPLQQYLCSPRCTAPSPVTSSESESEEEGVVPPDKIKKVLLG
ncbi:PREDICTED: leucine-rich repeat-containing protein 58-like [Branchiostoma belcheri]|uniref:Leucine-rich repeat-containing protein 58-like n=1 Tax=Branchiostoma belcheri TaxID=7741 RepID=A0A6P5AUR3_BRABE|nr:PREDICTED: leucine-rich repeat-containing protein 58-like [Branchiostoma belcheri]